MAINNVVALVGGVGGAKLAHGLAQILAPEQLTIIVNTGDDFWLYGLRICPDLDTVMYTLSGLVDKTNGWGVAGDTTHMLGALQHYGEEPWFRLGDKDIATHLLRTQALRGGATMTLATQQLTKNLGIPHHVLPMTDTPIATIIDTIEHGRLEFQHYFVRYRWQPTVRAIEFDGCADAVLTPEVQNALASADAILIAPSNPWLSIAPILSIPGMSDALRGRDVPRVAISPIVGGQALKGPAAKLMAELGYMPSADTVAAYYGDIINGFVYDRQDANLSMPLARTITMNTIMHTDVDRAVLARNVLEWIADWGQR